MTTSTSSISNSSGNLKHFSQSGLLDAETAEKVRKANRGLSEYIQLIANEPSIGLFHVQEHIHRTIPKLVEIKNDYRTKGKQISDSSYDLNYSLSCIKNLRGLLTFQTIKKILDDTTETIEKKFTSRNIESSNSRAKRISMTPMALSKISELHSVVSSSSKLTFEPALQMHERASSKERKTSSMSVLANEPNNHSKNFKHNKIRELYRNTNVGGNSIQHEEDNNYEKAGDNQLSQSEVYQESIPIAETSTQSEEGCSVENLDNPSSENRKVSEDQQSTAFVPLKMKKFD